MIGQGLRAVAKLTEMLRIQGGACLALSILALLAEPAAAQVQTVTAPVFASVDAQGVDAVTGAYWSSAGEVVIGRPGEGGLVHGRTWINSGWRDWLAGTISSSGTKYSVSIGARTETFTYSSPNFTSDQAVGSTLIFNSGANKYTYTTADGTVFVFNKALATTGSTTNFWASNEGSIETITQPTGEITTYIYWTASAGGQTAIRPQSITNNLGYQIFFTYAIAKTPTTAAEVTGGYLTRTQAAGYNRGFFFCKDNMADVNATGTCATSTGGKWPYVTYTNSGAFEYVTDRLSNKTTYSFYTSGRTQMQGWAPPSSPTAILKTIAYFTSGAHTGKVSGVTSTGAWNYTYSDAGGVRTTSVTSPATTLTLIKSVIASGWATEVWGDASGNHKTVYHRDGYGRVDKITTADDDTGAADPYVEYTFDGRGNITQTRAVAKPDTRPTITTYASYEGTCSDPKKCNQPLTTTDALGGVTTYSYDPTQGHRSLVKVVYPAPTSTSVQPETRYSYTGLSAYYLNSNGALVAGPTVYKLTGQSTCMVGASSGAGCATSSDETKRTIGYGSTSAPNNLLAASITSASGNGSLTVLEAQITYTVQGDVASVDGPVSGVGDTLSYYYDEIRRVLATAVRTPSGNSYRINRVTYNADGNPTVNEFGVYGTPPNWASLDPSAMVSLQKVTTGYTGRGQANWSKTEGRTTAGGSFQTFSIVEQGYDADGRDGCSALRMNPANYASSTPGTTVACNQTTNGSYGPDRISSPTFNAYNQASTVSSGKSTPLQRDDVVRAFTTAGLLSTETDAKGNTTTYTYDGFNRLVQTRFPGSSSDCTTPPRDCIELAYDGYGRLISRKGRDNLTFTFAYDNLGRLVTYTPPPSPSLQPVISYTYDNLGRITQASSSAIPGVAANTTSYVYDALSRRTSETQAGKTVTYDYDSAGRRTQMTWPDGYFVTYAYADTGELLTIKENGSTTLATFTYDDLGRRTRLTRANSSKTDYTYDGISQLANLALDLGSSATTNDLQVGLTYNPASQIVTRTVSNNAYVPAAPSVYTDAYTSNVLNQYSAITGLSPTYTDKRGNMTGDGTKAYTYDFDNKMLSAGSTTMSYDPSGRLYQVAGSSTRRFLYDGADIIAELDTSGNVLRRYVHGPGVDEPLVRYDGATTATKNQLYADERGSIVATEGASTYLYKYDEYGVPAASQSDLFQYTGQVWLADVGLYYYKARFYNADIGRFMQTDPIGYGAGMNMYNYVGSDPVNFTDPFGREPCAGRDDCWVVRGKPWNDLCTADCLIGPFFFDLVWGLPVRIVEDLGRGAVDTANDGACYASSMAANGLKRSGVSGPGPNGTGHVTGGIGGAFGEGAGAGLDVGSWYSPSTGHYGYYGTASGFFGVQAGVGPTAGGSSEPNPAGISLSVIMGVAVPRIAGEVGLSAEKGPSGPTPLVDASASPNSLTVGGYVGGAIQGAVDCGTLN